MKKKKKTHFKQLLAPAMSDGTVQFQKKTYKIFIRYSSLPPILILPIKLKCLDVEELSKAPPAPSVSFFFLILT